MSAIQKQGSTLLLERYRAVRERSLEICAPLATDDYQVQPMADASPPKWHLAHITWFFETFILLDQVKGYRPFQSGFEKLFNSYYQGIGRPYPRHNRGHLSRPTLEEVFAYRAAVDSAMFDLLATELSADIRFRVELGLHHEQQHQELLITDLKYNLGNNPLKPAYLADQGSQERVATAAGWQEFTGGLVEIGSRGDGFVFDNETPRHNVFLRPYALATKVVTNGDFLAFIDDDGYARHDLWLADAWAHLDNLPQRWQAPLYWREDEGRWLEYTLKGERDLVLEAPVCHISAYEADAFARWSGARLPSEAEWETASSMTTVDGNFVESENYHPQIQSGQGMVGMFGDVWEWTSSSYGPYPGFKPFAGALGEYNGKFMANQLVLRGGSCATPLTHIRPTYRNFFYPPDRWQFTGLRLAKDLA